MEAREREEGWGGHISKGGGHGGRGNWGLGTGGKTGKDSTMASGEKTMGKGGITAKTNTFKKQMQVERRFDWDQGHGNGFG